VATIACCKRAKSCFASDSLNPQIGYVAGPIRPTDLHYIYASHPAGHARLDQSQYQRMDDPQVNIS
jgi:hypothetical protein